MHESSLLSPQSPPPYRSSSRYCSPLSLTLTQILTVDDSKTLNECQHVKSPLGDSHFRPTSFHHQETSGSDTCRKFLFLWCIIAVAYAWAEVSTKGRLTDPVLTRLCAECEPFTLISVCTESHIPWGCHLFTGPLKLPLSWGEGQSKAG